MSHELNPIGPRLPSAADKHVGERILYRRRMLNVSQEKLSRKLGLTFQQIQKYENATNRVAAGRLFEISQALKATPAFFFEGLDGRPEGTNIEAQSPRLLGARGAYELLTLYNALSPTNRALLRDCARAFTKDAK